MTWDWHFFLETSYNNETGEMILVWQKFLLAWAGTFKIAALSWIMALVIGTFIGILRTLPRGKKPVFTILNYVGTTWVEVFRNIPILVQVFLWLYVIPDLIPLFAPLKQSHLVLAILALGFFTSARVAEQVRAGIQSIPRGMRYASQALGLNAAQTYRYVLLPITIRTIMPPLVSESMNIVKNSSVAIALSGIFELLEFTNEFGQLREDILMQIFVLVTIAYSLTALAFSFFMKLIERRLRVPGYSAGQAAGDQ